MAEEIGVFSFGRKQSQRCPNKMLRPFAGTTLTDIVLSKLSRWGPRSFFAGCEEEFREKCARHRVRFVQRDPRSVRIDEPIVEILSFLREVDYRYVLLVSSCAPFLRPETIEAFLRDCEAHGCQPAFSVAARRKHFMSQGRRAINFSQSGGTLNTKAVTPIYELMDALYFFDRRYFLREGRYWDWRAVRLIELNSQHECFDVDTEEDFALAEALWRARGGGGAFQEGEACLSVDSPS